MHKFKVEMKKMIELSRDCNRVFVVALKEDNSSVYSLFTYL